MTWLSSGARQGLRRCALGLAAIAAVLTVTNDAAQARHHRRTHVHFARHPTRGHRHVNVAYAPPTASIVVDGNTGRVLEASNSDALRHPASLTKVMTLYLLFEQLEAGRIRLDTPLRVSEHAAAQAPTKLGLKPGGTISVEDAIEGIVTRSANDAAVVIAENLGGDEAHFARLMTQTARRLGMNRTTYVNASGLPDDDQITTARDQALLAHAIEARFPRYYKFFSTRSFVFRGQTIRGHNHLLGTVPGVDGIKTGFTRASGFNLLTSLHRDGRYLLAVVLGGRSAAQRDAHMRALLATDIKMAARRRAPTRVAERGGQAERKGEIRPPAFANQPMSLGADPTSTATVRRRVAAGSTAPIRPIVVKTISYRTVTVRDGSLAPMPVLVPVADPSAPSRSRQSVVSLQPQPAAPAPAPSLEASRALVASADPTAAIGPASAVPEASARVNSVPATRPHARSGWMIQIGAFGDEDEARQHLSEAQIKARAVLASADPFTERVQKGDKTYYRARFAGFGKATAEAACRQLKRNDFECMALKD
jgi:D-alanyl-D-alanine carboxypeptidase